jgi:hypothetical protein
VAAAIQRQQQHRQERQQKEHHLWQCYSAPRSTCAICCVGSGWRACAPLYML